MKLDEEFLVEMKALRKMNKLTQAELAEKAGISLTSYQGYERGEVSPTIETLHKIMNALDSDICVDASEEKMTSIQEIQSKRNAMILSDLKSGLTTITPKRASEITGWKPETIKSSIREGKVHFGFCHRGENCKSWSTVIDLVKLYDYLNEYRGQNHISE